MLDVVHISVVYAHTSTEIFVCECTLAVGSTVRDAVVSSGVLDAYVLGSVDALNVGIFGHRQPLTRILQENDRVEIYRSLIIDPKDRRINKVNSVRNNKKWRKLNSNSVK